MGQQLVLKMRPPVYFCSFLLGGLYNGMLSPWTNFSIKAALWYQGMRVGHSNPCCRKPIVDSHFTLGQIRNLSHVFAIVILTQQSPLLTPARPILTPPTGEANADQSCQSNGTAHTDPIAYYATAYAAMVRDWRDSKGVGPFPIATMQLPPRCARHHCCGSCMGVCVVHDSGSCGRLRPCSVPCSALQSSLRIVVVLCPADAL